MYRDPPNNYRHCNAIFNRQYSKSWIPFDKGSKSWAKQQPETRDTSRSKRRWCIWRQLRRHEDNVFMMSQLDALQSALDAGFISYDTNAVRELWCSNFVWGEGGARIASHDFSPGSLKREQIEGVRFAVGGGRKQTKISLFFCCKLFWQARFQTKKTF